VRDAVRNGKRRPCNGLCNRGHLLKGGNIYQPPSMRRMCRACYLARTSFQPGEHPTEDQLRAVSNFYYARIVRAS
jgi:hypothetical protein